MAVLTVMNRGGKYFNRPLAIELKSGSFTLKQMERCELDNATYENKLLTLWMNNWINKNVKKQAQNRIQLK